MTNPFAATLERLHLLKHPFYQDWMAGRLTRETLKDYSEQYFAHVDAFPRYLSAVHSECENPEARKILVENLADEEGLTYGTPHPELWLRFAEGMGSSRDEVHSTEKRSGISNVVSTFMSLARSSTAEGLGALYAYEAQAPEIAGTKISGLKANYGIEDERTLSFFAVHEKADVEHREALARLIDSLPPEDKARAEAAAEKAAQSLWDFLSDVHARQDAKLAV